MSSATTPVPETLSARVKRCIIESLGVDVAPSALADDLALLDRGLGLDSVAILRLVGLLETEFDLEIEDQALRPELFKSVGTLCTYMASRVDESAPAARRA